MNPVCSTTHELIIVAGFDLLEEAMEDDGSARGR